MNWCRRDSGRSWSTAPESAGRCSTPRSSRRVRRRVGRPPRACPASSTRRLRPARAPGFSAAFVDGTATRQPVLYPPSSRERCLCLGRATWAHAQQYQAAFDELVGQGFRPVWVSGAASATSHLCGDLRQAPGTCLRRTPWPTVRRNTRRPSTTLRQQGFRPTVVSTAGAGGQLSVRCHLGKALAPGARWQGQTGRAGRSNDSPGATRLADERRMLGAEPCASFCSGRCSPRYHRLDTHPLNRER